MAENKNVQPPVWPVVQKIIKMTGSLQAWLGIAILLDLLQAAFVVLGNDYNRKFFDAVSNNQPDIFWYFVVLSLVLSLVGIPISYLRVWSLGRFSEGGLARIRRAIASHSTRLPVAYLEERH